MVLIPETYAEKFSTPPFFQEECKPYLNDSVALFSRLELKKVIVISSIYQKSLLTHTNIDILKFVYYVPVQDGTEFVNLVTPSLCGQG